MHQHSRKNEAHSLAAHHSKFGLTPLLQSASDHFLGPSKAREGTQLMELTPKQLSLLALAYADAGIRDKPLLLGISEVSMPLITTAISSPLVYV